MMATNGTFTIPLAQWPRPLAFVLSGGGAYGATQVGMIQALRAVGVTPDLIVGSSVGALNGTLLAADSAGAVQRLTDVWTTMHGRGVFGRGSRLGAVVAAVRHRRTSARPSLVSPEPLKRLVSSHLPMASIEQLPIRTGIVVTDIETASPTILTEGPLAAALQASAAIPGVFPPVTIDGREVIDGGVSANVPVRQAIALGARSVVVLDAMPGQLPATAPRSIIGSVMVASAIMLRNQQAGSIDELGPDFPILRLPRTTPATKSSFDFSNSAALIDAACTATLDLLGRQPAAVNRPG